jgi:general secretion pathway protein J
LRASFSSIRGAALAASQGGFTLLELVVAVGIFALMSAIAYGGLLSVLATAAGTEDQSERLGEIQLAMARLERDVEQMVPRPVRDQFGDLRQALVAGGGGTTMEFTRAGYPNPVDLPRSTLQRVQWSLDGDTLYRVPWPVLDSPVGAEDPLPEIVLTSVQGLELRFLGADDQWHVEWPVETGGEPDATLPRALEVRLELSDWGDIRRILLIPGGVV